MTRADGTVVRLAGGEWIRLILFIAIQSIGLLGLGVSMLTRIAVLETRDQETQSRQVMVLEELREVKADIKALSAARHQ